MSRMLLAALVLSLPVTVMAADDLKIRQMEQDIIRLQRDVQEQARQIEMLRAQLRLPAQSPAPRPPAAADAVATGAWIDASKWARLQTGMGELEVIALLGPPTSMRRPDEAGRVLLYALEIGTNGFLAGSVTLRDGRVTAVQVPRLQ